jgi:hypothetical protein
MTKHPTSSCGIRPLEEAKYNMVESLLDEALGGSHNEEWFAWKHRENPFGKSFGWIAEDDDGIAGVRLLMRWNLQCGNQQIRALRPVDTATALRARKHGIFRALTQHAIEEISQWTEFDLVFNTPNANSRPGYSSMGWTILPRISHGFRPVAFGSTSEIIETDTAFDAFDSSAHQQDKITTSRTPQLLRWRYDRRSGVEYGRAVLKQSDAINGIVYRTIVRRGIRLLLIHELAGSPRERSLLARSVARYERAPAIFFAAGEGALKLLPGPFLPRGSSVLAVRPLKHFLPSPEQRANWALTLGDLERVI